MFAASRYITYNSAWTERARIMKSADGAEAFTKDVTSGKLKPFLLKCLLFTCLEMQNHMRTFTGSDGRFYRNELCLDTTNGATLASTDLEQLVPDKAEQKLLNLWTRVMHCAKAAKEYNPTMTYGIYQIAVELDTSYKDDITKKPVYNNPELHSALSTLKTFIRAYYNDEIVPTLFEYEFLK